MVETNDKAPERKWLVQDDGALLLVGYKIRIRFAPGPQPFTLESDFHGQIAKYETLGMAKYTADWKADEIDAFLLTDLGAAHG